MRWFRSDPDQPEFLTELVLLVLFAATLWVGGAGAFLLIDILVTRSRFGP